MYDVYYVQDHFFAKTISWTFGGGNHFHFRFSIYQWPWHNLALYSGHWMECTVYRVHAVSGTTRHSVTRPPTLYTVQCALHLQCTRYIIYIRCRIYSPYYVLLVWYHLTSGIIHRTVYSVHCTCTYVIHKNSNNYSWFDIYCFIRFDKKMCVFNKIILRFI